jgi:ubiquinone/menaquinone biosynthesis C-methylase UbiE
LKMIQPIKSENIPATLRTALREGGYFVLEAVAALSGGDDFVPPSWLPLAGDGDFRAVGREFLRYFVEIGGLSVEDQVLEVGCGLGRMALPLASYLDPAKGRYVGFDVDKRAIQWCRKRITPKHNNFEFKHADVFNAMYHRGGSNEGAAYCFPFRDESFDFVISTSVFTHMLPKEVGNYIAQISRVMRPGGRCLMTFFLLNPESLIFMNSGRSELNFAYAYGRYRLLNSKIPEVGVALDQEAVESWCSANGLTVMEPVRYGSWCGRPNYLSYQDIVLASKRKVGSFVLGRRRA